jgi:hypothetical protein
MGIAGIFKDATFTAILRLSFSGKADKVSRSLGGLERIPHGWIEPLMRGGMNGPEEFGR